MTASAIARAAIGTLLAATPVLAQDVPSYESKPCVREIPGALCGTLTVWEDRDAESGRKLDLNVVVLEATGDERKPDPIYVLMGGPGQGAASSAVGWIRNPFRADRDIVLMDQRGTGESNRLLCLHPDEAPVDAYLGALFVPDRLRECIPELETHADLTKYQSPYSLDDLDDLRAALGHDQINLWGGSYGTRAAQVYIRRHEEHVRTAVLNASMSMSQVMPDGMARDAEASIRGVIEDCMSMPDCAEKYPNLADDYAAAVAGAREPVAVTVPDPRTGDTVQATMQPAGFSEALRAMLYSAGQTRDVPRLLHIAATTGNYDGFATFGAARNYGISRIAANGMYLSVTCAEDVPFANEHGEYEQGAGTFLADARARAHHDSCRVWPRGEVPEDFHDNVISDVPVLILSGSHDPVTPPRWGEEAATGLSRSIHVIVPFGHHSWGALENAGACVLSIQREFLDNPTGSPDTDCLKTIRRRPFN
jgi:pimeloyl-ACP methyl ester carboxylesterase